MEYDIYGEKHHVYLKKLLFIVETIRIYLLHLTFVIFNKKLLFIVFFQELNFLMRKDAKVDLEVNKTLFNFGAIIYAHIFDLRLIGK